MSQNMVKLGQMVVNVVENGLIGVDVGSRGRTWLTQGECGLMWQNIVNEGNVGINIVEH